MGLDEVLQEALAHLAEKGKLPDAQRERLLVRLEEDQRPPVEELGHGCRVLRLSHHGKGAPQAILLRLTGPFVARDGARVRFLSPEQLAYLDAEEEPEGEREATGGP